MTSRLRLALLGVAACAFAVFAWWLSGIWSPTPPRSLTIATGPDGGASAVVALRYREILSRAGVDVRLEETAGSVENLARLRDPRSGVSAGFLQAGITSAAEAPDLVSLRTVFYEPLWFFRRHSGTTTGLVDLVGKRMAVGPARRGLRGGGGARRGPDVAGARRACEARSPGPSLSCTLAGCRGSASRESRRVSSAMMCPHVLEDL